MNRIKRIQPERLIDTVSEIKKLDAILQEFPGVVKEHWLRVEIAIVVDRDCLIEYIDGEYDEGTPQTFENTIKRMESELEAIKQLKYGIHPKLPDWFKSIDCAAISEVK
jgi:hypothetical protein